MRPSPYLNLGRLFAASAGLRAGRDLLVDGERRREGAAAERETRRRAGILSRHGLAPGGRIAFLCRPGAAHALSWFAAVRLGGVATNLHVLETDRRLAETVAWLDAEVLACDAEFLARAEAFLADAPRRPALVCVGEAADGIPSLAGGPGAVPSPTLDAAAPDDLAAIVLSSGSTGRPKGVLHTHRTLLANAAAGPAVYGRLTPDDSVLIAIGASFGGWLNIVLPFLAAGAKLAFQPRFDAMGFLRGLAAERISHAPLVPTMWRHALSAGPEGHDLSALRSVFLSGEAAGEEVVAALRARVGPEVRSAYLSTEGGCGCGIVTVSSEGGPAGRGGLPVPGCEVRVAPGGEVLLRGPSLATGYWKDSERSRTSFAGGWWRTGDVGRLEDGRLVTSGRVDHVINSGGVKIQAEEVELALMRHPQVAQAAVIGVDDPDWGQRVEGFVVATEPGLAPDAILAWCRADGAVPSLKLPKRLHLRDRLPTGATGKLYRPALAAVAEPPS